MKRSPSIALALLTLCGATIPSHAQTDTVIVNDTWADGNRTSSGPDGGGIDSQWFSSTSADLTVPAPGDMRAVQPAGSLALTTYFPGQTLVNPGDELSIALTFTLTTVSPINVNANFLMAAAHTPGTKLTADGTPSQQIYSGYAMFMNMGQTLSNAPAFALREWINPAAGSLLGTSANWGANGSAGNLGLAAITGGGNTGAAGAGYQAGVPYTMTMTYQLDSVTNGQLDVITSMVGTGFNGVGFMSITNYDASPNTLTFDTFALRNGTSSATAGQFDFSNFKVDLLTEAPEPASFAIIGMGLIGMGLGYRRLRR